MQASDLGIFWECAAGNIPPVTTPLPFSATVQSISLKGPTGFGWRKRCPLALRALQSADALATLPRAIRSFRAFRPFPDTPPVAFPFFFYWAAAAPWNGRAALQYHVEWPPLHPHTAVLCQCHPEPQRVGHHAYACHVAASAASVSSAGAYSARKVRPYLRSRICQHRNATPSQ